MSNVNLVNHFRPGSIYASPDAKAFLLDGTPIEPEEIHDYAHVRVEDNDWIQVDLERINNLPYIHMKVFEWNPTVYLYLKDRFKYLHELLYLDGYEYLLTYVQNKKFADKMGENIHLGYVEHNDKRYDVVAWAVQ